MPRIIIFLLYIVLISCGGGFKDYPATPIEQVDFLSHAETKTENGITVTTSVLTSEETDKIFGVNLFSKGIQPVWIDITNNTDIEYVFLPISIDPDYFAPNEVAYLFQGLFGGGEVHPQLSERFNKYGYELDVINPGESQNGFVYTNFDPGIKYVNITLFSEEIIETFVFYLVLGDARDEFNEVDFNIIYTDDEYKNYYNENDFKIAIQDLHCNVQNKDNNEDVYPINFVFVGSDEDIFSALIRRGWDVTEPFSDVWKKMDSKKYFSTPLFRTTPMENFYYFDRAQDVNLQKSRKKTVGTVRQRNEMRIWLAPIRFLDKRVWVGSITRDVGTDVDKVKDFLTKKIDPDLDETRSFLVEDMALSQSVNKIGYLNNCEPTNKDNPNINYKNQPWWSDGLVLVLLFDELPNTIGDITFYDWEFPGQYLETYYKEKINTESDVK